MDCIFSDLRLDTQITNLGFRTLGQHERVGKDLTDGKRTVESGHVRVGSDSEVSGVARHVWSWEKAEVNQRKADIPARMSLVEGRAEVDPTHRDFR